MNQELVIQPVTIQVSPNFSDRVPSEPQQSEAMTKLSALVVSPEQRKYLVCEKLLIGETLTKAEAEAKEVLARILSNTQVLAVFGTDALQAVNQLSDEMLAKRAPVDIPEVRVAMKVLSRRMRGIGKKYDPNNPKVLEKYERAKESFMGSVLTKFHIGKTFLQEFLDDIRSLQDQFKQVTSTLEDKQYQLLRNVAYYDEFYRLNELEMGKLIYKIAVMEFMRDNAAKQAGNITPGDSNIGDRRGEEKARLSELVNLLENKISAYQGRLFVAWAMSPQIRNMRAISVGLSARIDQTVEIIIPTMKSTIVVWFTLNEAQQAEQFNKAVEDAYNGVMVLFANATKATVPALVDALAMTALDPRTVQAWSESLADQAEAMVKAIDLGQERRAILEDSMIRGKEVIDAATERVNQAQLDHILAVAQEKPLEITHSIPDEG